MPLLSFSLTLLYSLCVKGLLLLSLVLAPCLLSLSWVLLLSVFGPLSLVLSQILSCLLSLSLSLLSLRILPFCCLTLLSLLPSLPSVSWCKMSLLKAVDNKDVAEATRLLNNGANVDELDGDGWTPLHHGSEPASVTSNSFTLTPFPFTIFP